MAFKKKRTLLIDGDIFLYKSLFVSEESFEFAPGQFSLVSNLDAATASFNSRIERIVDLTQADPVICLSDAHENFRKEIDPTYKAPRATSRKPINLPELRAIVQDQWTCASKPRMEADDVMGILATCDVIPGRKMIVSTDKDMLQIPTAHLNPDKIEDGSFHVTAFEGMTAFLTQILTGDVVDNYPGCPGVGPVKAKKIIEAIEEGDEWWMHIVAAFEKAGLTEADALKQARLAKILQSSDYNSISKEIILWTP